MPNPNPEEFAKAMLWHLTGLRADMSQMQFAMIELKATLSQRDPVGISEKWLEDTKRLHKKLYQEALSAAGLHDDRHPDDDTSDGAPPRR